LFWAVQALYGVVVYVLMRLPLTAWCGRWSRQTATGYHHQTESPSDQHHHQHHHHRHQQQQQQHCCDVISLDSEQQSKFANELSQQIIIDSAQVCLRLSCSLHSTRHHLSYL